MNLKTILKGMLETRDCLGLQEHKVLTLNTIYKFPIEEPKTKEMRIIKDFGMGCFREGWIHAVSIIQESLDEKVNKKRTNGEIINSINGLLGFTDYKDRIKWSNANKEEMLRLESAIKKIKECK